MTMTLNEIMNAIDALSADQRVEFEARWERRQATQRLFQLFDEVRASMSPQDFDEMIEAMNEEYIEPWDENEWPADES